MKGKGKKRKGSNIKLDVKKTFDKDDWGFLNNILAPKGFGQKSG